MPSRGLGRSAWVFIATVCAAGSILFAGDAAAQCSARYDLQPAARNGSPDLVRPHATAPGLPTWKTITLGTFATSLGLRNALDAAGCGVGDLAEEALARRDFAVHAARADVDLVAISAAELGVADDTASLADIYLRAEKLGLRMVPAEAGPQLRLQYPDQPVGEFLHVAMTPIKTWEGDEVLFVVANGGAGLILIGEIADAHARIPAAARFLFLRPHAIAHNE